MKKLMLFAVCGMAVMMGCKNKDKTNPTTGMIDSATVAVIDSIIGENDTTPMPMFLMGEDAQYAQMLYWSYLEEPKKNEEYPEYYEPEHRSWALQEMFRRNKTEYTNMLMGDKFVKIKFVDEVLKDPDGGTPSIGDRHGRIGIPSLCARFDFVNPKDKKKGEYGGYEWGTVVVTDSYLHSRKMLPIVFDQSEWDNPKPLPKAAVSQLEKKYGMQTERMRLCATIDGRYIWGNLQFKGEYKNAPKDGFYKDSKVALALDVLIDGEKVYVHEELGLYDEEYGPGWNADDGGEYVGCYPLAVFEGPKGLEICFERDAPESSAVGLFCLRNDQLIQHIYETYHNMVDEEIPVWKKDIAEMQKLFVAENPGENKHVNLTKWAHCFIDYDNEWIWLRDKDDQNGAIFIRKDGKLRLVAIETPKLKPSRMMKDGVGYLRISGSAGGPAMYSEIFAFKNGQQIEHFTALSIYDEIDECSLNGKSISKEAGQAYLDKLPAPEELTAYFTDTEEERE